MASCGRSAAWLSRRIKADDEPAGLDWKLAGDARDEDIPKAEHLFTRLCGDLSRFSRAAPSRCQPNVMLFV
jgi:hypothetical protein